MNIKELLDIVEQKLLQRPLSPIERLVLSQSWQKQTYAAIARNSAYGGDYIKEVGARLWHAFSVELQQRVTKKNLHLVLESYFQQNSFNSDAIAPQSNSAIANTISFDFLGGPLPLNSPFYIARSPIEDLVYREIAKPCCEIRIKGSHKTGKSSLLIRLLAQAHKLNYRVVQINFQEADISIFDSLSRFLRWFCANTSHQLNIASRLDNYWPEDLMGSKLSCRLYFEQYLLPQLNTPLVLALNEAHYLFSYTSVAQDFFAMLQSWYEQSAQSQLWQNFRLVLVYNTEIYQFLSGNQFPGSTGLAVQLPDFTLEQVKCLAERYQLETVLNSSDLSSLDALYNWVGGHPYLINIAFSHLASKNLSLAELLTNIATPAGIYSDCLRNHLFELQTLPHLQKAFIQVIKANTGIQIDAIAAFKLESMGLVRFEGDLVAPRCQLYAQFFHEYFKLTNSAIAPEKTSEITSLVSHPMAFDELTGLANRRQFDTYLQEVWQSHSRLELSLSLILGDLDYFKLFNTTRGRLAGDTCLQLIAQTLQEIIPTTQSLTARYGGEEFAVLLSDTSLNIAIKTAQTIRDRIKALGISHDQTNISGLPDEMLTMSIGVATVIPTALTSSKSLVAQADRALYQAKRLGRDRVETANSTATTPH
ncbi:MAG: AAA-like domain-containing protein [Jaaginema sp. PMC 1079.18]|nr:AAA-like domain-containing protein [Jaaginema sp. PMC 1080.18]MEC4851562.1 AAA-like domain-containing protein [Jaaginema sp. PMC 1079.18]MEC4868690.1 AAA-like domain-containing protein [Jaaginema sp. PMC 1078.18]